MPEEVLAVEGKPLSQTERVVDTFVAPTKTFADVLRSASWWLPFLLLMIAGYALTATIQTKVGWQQLVENEIKSNPKMSDQMSSLSADQVATRQRIMQMSFRGGFYAGPVLNLAFVALSALLLWPTINFGFGGRATYGRIFCVGMYAALPGMISGLLAALMLWAGRSPETFSTQTMLGSNPGYYIDTPGALKTFLTSLDLFTIWTLVLLSIGLSIVAHTKRSAGYLSVFGWFAVVVLFRTAMAAINS